MNRRNILLKVLVTAIVSATASQVAWAARKQDKSIPDWNKANEEVEEAKMEAAFNKLKDTEEFRAAINASNGKSVARQIQDAAGTNYNVTVSFKGKKQERNNFKFTINCFKDKSGEWNFAIVIILLPYKL